MQVNGMNMNTSPPRLLLRLLAVALTFGAASGAYRNVYGDDLQPCSQDGMALTGYGRSGYCVDKDDDSGSHHICIDLGSASGGNFCDVTGQDDWCSSQMPCHDDASSYCDVQRWCVCQWAFASYLENAGGCDQIQDIVCDAINLEALKGYYRQVDTAKYQNALDCIVARCGVENAALYTAAGRGRLMGGLFLAALVVGAGLVAAVLFSRRRSVDAALEDGFVKIPN